MPTGCAIAPTFASIDCRLDALIAQVTAANDLGKVKESLLHQLNEAKSRKEQAEMLCGEGRTRQGRAALRHAVRWMIGFVNRVGSLTGHRQIAEATRQMLFAEGNSILEDLQALPCTPAAPSTTTTVPPTTTTTVTTTTTTRPPTTTTTTTAQSPSGAFLDLGSRSI